ncbi:hypothetical protein Q8A64_09795 [Oxalobacteraceae bacterium R-40]|uniref:Uncharacterized protein n=1 Tax=Keguizhuia sedimenti TaxID=3064264 RepID=A0ABU1BNY1_9BURK|nr:hypothetical protein [Oxalobacteraceae bacterium R-40]
MSEIEKEFTSYLWEQLAKAQAHGYVDHDGIYAGMLERYGGVGTAKQLIASYGRNADNAKSQAGLKQLAKLGLLEFSTEAAMLTSQFKRLFTKHERDIADWRLRYPNE